MRLPPAVVLGFLLLPAAAGAQTSGSPRTHVPEPTTGAITAADLLTRLSIFADDSMHGRETGTLGHRTSTDYIAAELHRLGLEPAGDAGTYFQNLPMIRRAFDVHSTLAVDGVVLHGGTDFIATARGSVPDFDGVRVVFGGTARDTTDMLSPDQARGKLVVLRPARDGGGQDRFRRRGNRATQALSGAVAVATVAEALDPTLVRSATHPREGDVFLASADAPQLTITARAAALLLGSTPDSAVTGQAGKTVTGTIRFRDEPAPARNVVAIFRGSDAAVRNEYVAIGSHSDHVGVADGQPVDHDSLHLYNEARFAVTGMVPRGQRPTAEQQARVASIRVNLDSVRGVRAARLDSIRNGADDDGSGSVTMLELAEALAATSTRPRRSILFVWHTAEEKGLLGSRWFSEHPTVPRDAIVAQLNLDMIERGATNDLPVGGPDYLALVGSRRLSTELGDLVEAVNAASANPLRLDYQFDADGHPENIYCRSDHYHYARWGIPVVFFTTGLHGDYHQVTDEPQYVDYPRMTRIGQLVYDVAVRVANLEHRPVVDRPLPDPNGPCRQ